MYAVLSCGRGNQLREIHLVDMVGRSAGKRISKRHNLSGPQGVRGRNSDKTRLREVLGWEPSIRLEQGLAGTFEWIAAQVLSKSPVSAVVSAAAD